MNGLMKGGFATICLLVSSAVAQVQVQSTQITGSQIEHDTLKMVEAGDHVRIEQMELPYGTVDLELDRIEVLTRNAELWVGSKDGLARLDRPDVIVLRGIVAGDADSVAYLAISPYGTNGFVQQNGELISISTGPYAQEKELRTALASARMDGLLDPASAPELCGYTAGDKSLEPSGPMIEYPADSTRGVATCRIAGLAVETDWEYTDRLFGGNADASAAYLVSLVGAISEIFERDVNVRLAIPFLRVWSDDSDPYNTTDDPLSQFRAEWNTNMTGVERTIAHYFTGRQNTGYGGVAYLSVLCNSNYGYGVSAYLNGSFPYPLVDHNGGNWDVVVTSHELGHNFGTGHTHDSYSPTIDDCGNGDCSQAYGGTIMSYCHTCAGGITNLVLNFHPRVQDTIVGYMDSIACDLVGEGLSAVADSVETLQDQVVQIDMLGNDESASCDSIALDSFDSVSAGGASITLLAGQGPGGRDMLEYTPVAGYEGLDTFGYSIAGISGTQATTVSVNVRALRPADTRLDPLDGLRVKYYELSNPSFLPDFSTLIPYAEDVSLSVNYPSTGGEFMNSGRSDNVGVVFSGYVLAIEDGIYTLTTDSDDGSRLYIGDEMVVDNDGLHGMEKVGGSIPLSAGWHQMRIEFFENGGGAGLIATIAGPAVEETNLEGLFISHESSEQCSVADFNADGSLNFFDVSAFLSAFSAQDPSADLTGNGTFNFFDISEFLTLFAAGCP